MVHTFHGDLASLILESISDAALFVGEFPARIVTIYTLKDVPDVAVSLRRFLHTMLQLEAVLFRNDLVVRVPFLKGSHLGALEDFLHAFALQVVQICRWNAARQVPGDGEQMLGILLGALHLALSPRSNV